MNDQESFPLLLFLHLVYLSTLLPCTVPYIPRFLTGSDSGDSDVQQQAADDATDDNRDAVVTDSDNDDDPHALDGLELDKALEIGDETEVGGRKWVRVEKTPGDCANWKKKDAPGMRMRHRTLNDSTREVDIHDDLLPISHDFILDIVQCRADQTSDKRRYTAHHVRGFLVCVYGGAQYKEGTDLWATKRVGMMPAPNFGRHLDKERFTRILRYLKAGPEGCEDEGDPWYPVRFMVGGYNKTRRRNFQWGWTAVIDETMFAWRGKGGAGGMPHLSYIPRKPEDLGSLSTSRNVFNLFKAASVLTYGYGWIGHD